MKLLLLILFTYFTLDSSNSIFLNIQLLPDLVRNEVENSLKSKSVLEKDFNMDTLQEFTWNSIVNECSDGMPLLLNCIKGQFFNTGTGTAK